MKLTECKTLKEIIETFKSNPGGINALDLKELLQIIEDHNLPMPDDDIICFLISNLKKRLIYHLYKILKDLS